MKTELFLEKIRNIKEVESIEKTKFGYEVKLKEGYVFADLNTNERIFSNQGIVGEHLKEVVERSFQEVDRLNNIKKLECTIKQEKYWCNYYIEKQKECRSSIERNKSEIEGYERAINYCNQRIDEKQKSFNWNKTEAEKYKDKILTLEKELQELQNN